MGTSEVFNSRIDHKNRTHNPLPPKNPLETIVTPTFANLDFRPPPFPSIFTIGNPIVEIHGSRGALHTRSTKNLFFSNVLQWWQIPKN